MALSLRTGNTRWQLAEEASSACTPGSPCCIQARCKCTVFSRKLCAISADTCVIRILTILYQEERSLTNVHDTMQVVMLRSLTSYVRLLPGYRMYRACKVKSCIGSAKPLFCLHALKDNAVASSKLCNVIHDCVNVQTFLQGMTKSSAQSSPLADLTALGYMQKSSSPARLGFCLLKGHQSTSGAAKTANLCHFSFTALDTPYGQLKLEVDYAPAAAVNFLEQSASPGHQPDFIPDYVRGANPVDRRRSSDAAPRGGLTASLQGSQRPQSLVNHGPAGLKTYHGPLLLHDASAC